MSEDNLYGGCGDGLFYLRQRCLPPIIHDGGKGTRCFSASYKLASLPFNLCTRVYLMINFYTRIRFVSRRQFRQSTYDGLL